MTEMKPTDPDNEDAPFGYMEDGTTPLAPFGYKVNGKPRQTNRGRQAGSASSGGTRKSGSSQKAKLKAETDAERKSALLLLSDTFIVSPLAGASTSGFLTKKLGKKHTDALAGDAVIWSVYAPSLADGLIAYSQQKPGVLAWLDGVEEKAPLIMLGNVGVQMARAFASNHIDPQPEVAKAGRRLARMNVAKMAQAINDEAAAMGIPTDDQLAAQAAAAASHAA